MPVRSSHPQPRVQDKKAHERSHHRYTAISRHSLRDGFTAYSMLSPVTGLSCHRHQRIISANLTPASGRQDHTTSPSVPAPLVSAPPPRPPHPAPTSVTIAIRPSHQGGTANQ